MTAISRTFWPSLLLLVTLTGCAASAAATAPRVPPAGVPTLAPRVVNPALDSLVGRMLAEKTLLDQSATLIGAAFIAESEQLPESAQADYTDAHGRLAGARAVTDLVGSPSSYGNVAALLNESLTWYSHSAADGTSQPARSQDAAERGHTFLVRAENLLQRSPEANQRATLAAEQAALSLASREQVQSQPVRRAPHRAGAQPAATATPAVRFVIRLRHSRRRFPTFHLPVIPTPRPTSTPTTTPVATAIPRAIVPPRVTSRPVIHRPPAYARRLATLKTGAVAFDLATSAVEKCAAVLSSINAGRDPGGATEITSCLTRADGRLLTVLRRLHRASTLLSRTPAAGSVAAAITAIRAARTELARALTDAEFINLVRTQTDLTAAAGSLDAARQSLLSAHKVLRQTH